MIMKEKLTPLDYVHLDGFDKIINFVRNEFSSLDCIFIC